MYEYSSSEYEEELDATARSRRRWCQWPVSCQVPEDDRTNLRDAIIAICMIIFLVSNYLDDPHDLLSVWDSYLANATLNFPNVTTGAR